jgi:hypothetical protein
MIVVGNEACESDRWSIFGASDLTPKSTCRMPRPAMYSSRSRAYLLLRHP